MKTLKHKTAKASYYNTRAYAYDELNENNSRAINALLEKILKEWINQRIYSEFYK